jgi:transposase-like protein
MYMGIGETMAKTRNKERERTSPPAWGGGERSEPEPRAGGGAATAAPNPEVSAKPARRRHTAEYKARILREADACAPGGVGALLRREGLYASQLATWRKQRDSGIEPKRGRRPSGNKQLAKENERQGRKIRQLTERLRKAELIIDVQKKLCIALGLEPHPGLDAE